MNFYALAALPLAAAAFAAAPAPAVSTHPASVVTYSCTRSGGSETCTLNTTILGPIRGWRLEVTTARHERLVMGEQVVSLPDSIPGNGGALGSGDPTIITPYEFSYDSIRRGCKVVASYIVTAPVRDRLRLSVSTWP